MIPTPAKTIPPQHNVVNLLYSIQGMAEAYRAEVEEERFSGPEERLRRAEELLKRNSAQAEQALAITKRLGHVLNRRPSSLRHRASLVKAWQAVRDHLEKRFPPSGREILERIPEGFPEIRCAQKELEEILYVLAANALEALGGAGTDGKPLGRKLIIRAQLGFSTKEEPYASITVADTGPGISEKKLPNLFQPFASTKSPGSGNGLGLYLARELVLKNEGRITAASFEEFGTTFTLEFPIASRCRANRRRNS